MSFDLLSTDGDARYGMLKTRSGKVKTPFFMPVCTRGTGKFIGIDDYNKIKSQCIINNSLLLSLRPGGKLIKEMGGLNKFIGFNGSTFTDSGGFQASSPGLFVMKSKRGIHFRDPFTTGKHMITPKQSMKIQHDIGADVAMAFDDMPNYGETQKDYALSMERTHAWAEICLREHIALQEKKNRQLLFGIIQGGFYQRLREQSAQVIRDMEVDDRGFDGIATGGLAIGEPTDEMFKVVDWVRPYLPEDRCRYFMGLGTPVDIIEAVKKGYDCFDSIYPTRSARHGNMFTWKGFLDLTRGKYAKDETPLDPDCQCEVCRNHSKAYLRHLFKIDDPEGKRLRQHHNLYFLKEFMEEIRKRIKECSLDKFQKEFSALWKKKL